MLRVVVCNAFGGWRFVAAENRQRVDVGGAGGVGRWKVLDGQMQMGFRRVLRWSE